MGLFSDIMNSLMGTKPRDSSNPVQSDGQTQPMGATPPSVPAPLIRKEDQNTFPVAHVKRVSSKINGGNMDVYAHIVNSWSQPIELDKIHILGVKRELDTYLRAGEEKELLIYRGPKVQREMREAELDYITYEGRDYFQARHDVKFAYHADDKTYSISDMHLELPIRDING